MSKGKFDPNEPEILARERLEPVYGSDGQRKRSLTDPFVLEQGQRAAYALLRDEYYSKKEKKEVSDK